VGVRERRRRGRRMRRVSPMRPSLFSRREVAWAGQRARAKNGPRQRSRILTLVTIPPREGTESVWAGGDPETAPRLSKKRARRRAAGRGAARGGRVRSRARQPPPPPTSPVRRPPSAVRRPPSAVRRPPSAAALSSPLLPSVALSCRRSSTPPSAYSAVHPSHPSRSLIPPHSHTHFV